MKLIGKMTAVLNTFPEWAIENLDYHVNNGKKILCGNSYSAISPEGG